MVFRKNCLIFVGYLREFQARAAFGILNFFVIRNKLKNQQYPFDSLCGAGVAYKLCYALIGDNANKYLDLFCKKSDTAKQYVQQWLPIVAASQSVKGREQEKEFLLSWVNVVDYE